MTCAVVFGYGDVGVRCLATLLAREIDVPLVVTHEDDISEVQWFASLARFAQERDIPVVTSQSIDSSQLYARVAACRPEFIFAFYYRAMLPQRLLALASSGALNMHGSLLPKFRGRAPVNWAIIEGEARTGASLHYMTAKPDAGAIVGQRAVPILPDDTALDVFRKVCVAAEMVLHEALPRLLNGDIEVIEQNLAAGSYFGARRPEDGTIDWSESAQRVHDLVRAVAPPFPGARTVLDRRAARILRTLREHQIESRFDEPTLFARGERCYASCGDGQALRLLEIEIEGEIADPASLARKLVQRTVMLPRLSTDLPTDQLTARSPI